MPHAMANTHKSGFLATQYDRPDLPLQVLRSAAGWYIGTFDSAEGPFSRESEEYYASEAEAQAALDAPPFSPESYTQRSHP